MIRCSLPDLPTHCYISDPNRLEWTVDQSVTYTCASGYRLNGSATLTCLNTGEWSSDPPICQGKMKFVRKNFPAEIFLLLTCNHHVIAFTTIYIKELFLMIIFDLCKMQNFKRVDFFYHRY